MNIIKEGSQAESRKNLNMRISSIHLVLNRRFAPMKIVTSYLLLLFCATFAQPVLSQKYDDRKLILRDEGLSQLSYVDIANPNNNWFVPVPAGRDLQLVGDEKVLIGTGDGYEERDIKTGNKVKELTSFKGTIAARRLANGNTLLTGLNWEGKQGIVLAEVDAGGKVQRVVNYPEFNYVRLVRPTPSGTFMVTSDTVIFEGDASGKIVWRAKIAWKKRPHTWQAIRLASGETVAATGYGGNFQVFDKSGNLVKSITGPTEVNPNFYAGFQILKNGNYVVTNWQGHGPGHGDSGTQLLEYTPKGILVWSWKQDPAKYSSLQGVIVLDGLNTKKLHVEDKNGALTPVK
jgi:hypothetical protein